jgi:hypothetical protein
MKEIDRKERNETIDVDLEGILDKRLERSTLNRAAEQLPAHPRDIIKNVSQSEAERCTM